MIIFRNTNRGNILHHANGSDIPPSQFECGTNGHSVCDCSKMLKAMVRRGDDERNPKISKQFRGYTWCGERSRVRRQRARPPPGTLNLRRGEVSLTLDGPNR